ncbi:hypothetical protein [Bordetella genomosp. 1]|nr:hypothetical protein [Bordetella genomosp. 1]
MFSRSLRKHGARIALMAAAGMVLSGCLSVSTQQVALAPVTDVDSANELSLARNVIFTLSNGTNQTLPAGSCWRRAGAIAQGDVYRPLDRNFVIQGRRQAEAWIVAAGGKLAGFYLPGERSYTPLSHPVTLPVEMRQ